MPIEVRFKTNETRTELCLEGLRRMENVSFRQGRRNWGARGGQGPPLFPWTSEILKKIFPEMAGNGVFRHLFLKISSGVDPRTPRQPGGENPSPPPGTQLAPSPHLNTFRRPCNVRNLVLLIQTSSVVHKDSLQALLCNVDILMCTLSDRWLAVNQVKGLFW